VVAGTSIVNVHEHIQSERQAPQLLRAMDAVGIEKTVLVGSSWFTITLDPKVGFTRYDLNNEEILRISENFPGRFEAWPTLDPQDPLNLDKLRRLHSRSASGLKLYIGHGYVSPLTGDYFFHTMAMDDSRMTPVYEYCVENFLPICFHVNPGPKTPGFAQEFVKVLQSFPDLLIIAPHWALSSIRLSRLRELLTKFPNLMTDISFGHDTYLMAGLRRISGSPQKYRKFIADFPDRVMFGTDLVITAARHKTDDWIQVRMKAYIDMLTLDQYESGVLPGEVLQGLGLDEILLDNILTDNYKQFRRRRPKETQLSKHIDWRAVGVTS
jgi:predicted TIM-barrel fold metal-dependent hydrolase